MKSKRIRDADDDDHEIIVSGSVSGYVKKTATISPPFAKQRIFGGEILLEVLSIHRAKLTTHFQTRATITASSEFSLQNLGRSKSGKNTID